MNPDAPHMRQMVARIQTFTGALLFVVLLTLLGVASSARADLVKTVNDIRASGCDGRSGGLAPLRAEPRLAAAARAMAGAATLDNALKEARYRSVKAVVLHVSGTADDAGIVRLLRERHCAAIADTAFREIGIFRSQGSMWAVLAAPFAAPGAADRAVVARTVLDLVNQVRAKPRECGGSRYPAAPPLKTNRLLDQAAQAHADDMAKQNYFSHEGRDGSFPAVRVGRTGYPWQSTAENIAAGNVSAEETVAGWLRSPEHCMNIMEGRFTELGVAFAVNERSTMGIYWVQVFGRPR